MSEHTFEVPTADYLVQAYNMYWEASLNSLRVPVLDADEDRTGIALTVSTDMPYRAAMDRYAGHVKICRTCQDLPVWDIGCETGGRLAHIAADAMAAQEDLAMQN